MESKSDLSKLTTDICELLCNIMGSGIVSSGPIVLSILGALFVNLNTGRPASCFVNSSGCCCASSLGVTELLELVDHWSSILRSSLFSGEWGLPLPNEEVSSASSIFESETRRGGRIDSVEVGSRAWLLSLLRRGTGINLGLIWNFTSMDRWREALAKALRAGDFFRK